MNTRRIIDGDSIVIFGGEDVRVMGVSAPEVGKRYAETATIFTTRLVHGRDIYVEFNVQARDTFGPILAYVYMEDSAGVWVAADDRRLRQLSHELTLAGFATAMTVPPHVEFAEAFVEAATDGTMACWACGRLWSCFGLKASSRD